jgi:hypothetical protein
MRAVTASVGRPVKVHGRPISLSDWRVFECLGLSDWRVLSV